MIAALACAVLGLLPVDVELNFIGFEGVPLKGTMVLPANAKGSPMVVLLPGSGPTDRNGNQPPAMVTDLLKSIAAELAEAGIGSFRFDKRAAHSNASLWPKSPVEMDKFFRFEAFVGDAVAAVKFIRSRPEVNPERLGLAGHSEGGLITAVAVAQHPRLVKSIALLSTASRTLDIVLKEQIDNILKLQKASPEVHKQHMDNLSESIQYVKSHGNTPPNVMPGLRALFGPGTGKLLQSYFTVDPIEHLDQFPGSILVLQGDLDAQISVTRDFPKLVAASKQRRAGATTSAIIVGASHNLKSVKKVTDPGIAGPVVPEALSQISSFFKKEL